MRFEDRAERISTEQVAETFVVAGPLLDLLSSKNNQVVFGRRGTGKTHALRYFQGLMQRQGDIAIYVDGQNLGSNGSIYNDNSLPISERATRLLVDLCTEIHHYLLELFADPDNGWDFSEAVPILDGFVDGFSEKRVSGPKEYETEITVAEQSHFNANVGFGAESVIPALSLGTKFDDHQGRKEINRSEGNEDSWIDCSFFSRTIKKLANFVAPRRVWLLLDEWTTIPAEMQPYVADLIRRSMFSVPNISVKLAAIEHRANFKLDRDDQSYVGLELGADIGAPLNLDDYVVIDVNEDRAKEFFRHFLLNHTRAVAKELDVGVLEEQLLIKTAFTQDNVFTEFVSASEGVPRDAMHILSLAAQKANTQEITMPIVRSAALAFFQTEKYTTIQASPSNRMMLDWIRDEVISGRQTRAFLLPVGIEDKIIESLFDRRALHILNRSRSAAHRPGERFIVYKLDYGLYVDLINTEKFPKGLLVQAESGDDIDFEVPVDDARSYRRAILDVDKFYAAHPELRA